MVNYHNFSGWQGKELESVGRGNHPVLHASRDDMQICIITCWPNCIIMKNSLIPERDYKRIFNTIYSVLLSEDAKINKSCVYFSVIGSLILQTHYNINAKVYMGIATYMLEETNELVLAFAENNGEQLVCSENGFHSWIIANNWVIDFTSPLFPKMINERNKTFSCKSKMFQKSIDSMCCSADKLKVNGDFFLYNDPNYTKEMMDYYTNHIFNIDIANICCQWYRRPPLNMKKAIPISNAVGKIKKVPLKSFQVTGSW